MSTPKSNDLQRQFLQSKRLREENVNPTPTPNPIANTNTNTTYHYNYSSIVSQSPQSHRNLKQDKIQKILMNFQRIDELIRKDEVKRLFDNIAKFSFDEIAKLLQNVANKEYISLTSKTNNAKEPITLNPTMLKFNPENLEVNDTDGELSLNEDNDDDGDEDEDGIDIHKIIIKNTKGKNVLKEKLAHLINANTNQSLSGNRKDSNSTDIMHKPQLQSQSQSQSQLQAESWTKEYFESITKNLKSILNNKVIDMGYLKNVIKLYSAFIHSNNKIIEQEDQLLLSVIKEVLFTVSSSSSSSALSYENFFELSNYWLYTEYILTEEHRYYRYDTLLNDIIMIIDPNINTNTNTGSNANITFLLANDTTAWSFWVKFISQIPRYTTSFINHLLKMHDLYFSANYDSLKKLSYEKVNFQDQLPHLMSFRQIYIDIINMDTNTNDPNANTKFNPNDKSSFREKLLNKFIQMSRNDYNHLNARAINFLFTYIYNISKDIDHYEEYQIRLLAVDGLKELLKIIDDSIEDEHSKKTFIEQRFPLYLHLCGKETEVIDELPEVYASSSQLVKSIFDRYMKLMMNNIDVFRARKLIMKCDDRCEEIVIAIIDIFYSNKANRVIEESIKEDGLFNKIALYYGKYYQLNKGVVVLCNRIPLSDFFLKENFVLNRVKQNVNTNNANANVNNNNERFDIEILDAMNRNDSLMIYDNDLDISNNDNRGDSKSLLDNIKNKVLIYIAYYFWNSSKDSSSLIEMSTIMPILMKYYFKLLLSLSEEEKSNELDAACRFMIKLRYPLLCFIDLFRGVLDYCRGNSNKEDIEALCPIVYKKITMFFNERMKISREPLEEFNDSFYKKLIEFIENEKLTSCLKENMLKLLDEGIKETLQGKDLILFRDL